MAKPSRRGCAPASRRPYRSSRAPQLIPGLAVVLVGEDPASKVYVANKARQTVEAGMKSWEYRIASTAPEAEVLGLVDKLNRDRNVHGILVQLPLPKHIDAAKVINALDPRQGRGRIPRDQCRPARHRAG